MKKVSDLDGNIFDVSHFEKHTNKDLKYYQNGRMYACCPACGSSVQIISGKCNLTHSRKSREAYASHTSSIIKDLPYKNYERCPLYSGNKNNWQGIYSCSDNKTNEQLNGYLKDRSLELADELTELTGIRFWKKTPKIIRGSPIVYSINSLDHLKNTVA